VTTWTPFAGKRVQIDRQGGDERLAFAGLHLGDLALMQHHAADQLNVEMALASVRLAASRTVGEGFGTSRSSSLVPSASCFAELAQSGRAIPRRSSPPSEAQAP
jgi:hypothetical protein